MLDKLTTIQAILTATLQLVLMNQCTGYIYCDLRLVFLLEQLEEQCMVSIVLHIVLQTLQLPEFHRTKHRGTLVPYNHCYTINVIWDDCYAFKAQHIHNECHINTDVKIDVRSYKMIIV